MKKDSIFFCYPKPDVVKPVRFGTSLSILYGIAIAIEMGFRVVYRDYSVQMYDPDDFRQQILSASIFIIELDSFPLKRSENKINGLRLIEEAKKYSPSLVRVVFGKLLNTSDDIDLDCEVVFKTSLETNFTCFLKDYSENKMNTVYQNVQRILLPFPAREYFDRILNSTGAYKKLSKSTLIRTSYGCHGGCTFCQRSSWNGPSYEMNPNDYVISEFRQIGEQGYKNIWIEDDNFTSNLRRAKDILSELARLPYTWKIALSTSTKIDDDFLFLAKKARVSIVSFGIETINIKSQIFYNKRQSPEKIRNLIAIANKLGIFTVGNFIIGSPFDSEESVLADVRFAAETGFDQINVKTLDYMRGASLYNKLPPNLRSSSHLFASQEVGLCPLSYSKIQELKEIYKTQFKLQNAERLKNKILKFGFPYNYRPH